MAMTKEAKQERAGYTKGPLVKGYYRTTPAFAAIVEHVAVMRPDGSLIAVTGRPDEAEGEANATLYAAAPELLALAHAVLLFHRGGPWTQADDARWNSLLAFAPGPMDKETTTKGLCDAARAAIRKVEGRES